MAPADIGPAMPVRPASVAVSPAEWVIMSNRPAKYTDDSTAQKLVARLFAAESELPDELREDFLTTDGDVSRVLMELVKDRSLRLATAPGNGWAPIHAVRLLGERREPAAVEPLIEIIREAELDEMIYSRAVFALQNIGKPALEPVLQAIESRCGPGEGKALAEVLCELGVRDERILRILLDILEEDPELGASYLASYGDPAALGPIHSTFESTEVHPTNPFVNHVFTELAAAIDELGGELTDREREKLDRANRIRRLVAQAVFGTEEPDELVSYIVTVDAIAPDEPCWCGSGTKYENCHGKSGRGTSP